LAMYKDSKEIERSIIGDIWSSPISYENEVALCSFGSRFGGTPSERKARDFILKKFKEYGLEAHIEPVEYTGWARGTAKLETVSPQKQTIPTISLVQSPSTPKEGLEGDMVFVGDGTPRDFSTMSAKLKDKIVMSTSRSPASFGRSIHRREKYGRAVQAGATGFIFMNSQPGKLQQTGSLRTNGIGQIPAVSVSYEEGYLLQQLLKSGSVRVKMTISNKTQPATSWFVVGEIPGSRYPDHEVVAGAHYDGHDIALGAVDNGTGTVIILEMARVLGRFRGQFKRTIKLVSFPLEEWAITGSTLYIRNHRKEMPDIDLMLNLDGVGSPGRKGVSVQGFTDLIPYFQRLGEDVGYRLNTSSRLSHSSDHFPFVTQGVPSISLTTDRTGVEDRGFGHTEADTLDKVDAFTLKEAAMISALIVSRVANEEKPLCVHKTEAEMLAQMKQDDMEEILRLIGLWDLFYPWPKT